MKRFYIFIVLAVLLTGSAVADNLTHPKGKHKSHKKAKKKKSGYYFNFQH